MKRFLFGGLAAVLIGAMALAAAGAAGAPSGPQAATNEKPISWDNWRAAKSAAEKYDNEGKYVEALQYYLEYARQAEGLGSPELVAWGKNDAAYMIIKRHKLDPSVDLAPAKRLLEEALAIDKVTEDCRKCLDMNMEYINLFLKK
jgi:hypothetical protein